MPMPNRIQSECIDDPPNDDWFHLHKCIRIENMTNHLPLITLIHVHSYHNWIDVIWFISISVDSSIINLTLCYDLLYSTSNSPNYCRHPESILNTFLNTLYLSSYNWLDSDWTQFQPFHSLLSPYSWLLVSIWHIHRLNTI